MLLAAADIGRANGLRYVYAGNLPGRVGDLEDTHCAACGELLIARYGYHIRDYRLTADGRCPSCARRGAGTLERAASTARSHRVRSFPGRAVYNSEF